jgi:hypothetical protein
MGSTSHSLMMASLPVSSSDEGQTRISYVPQASELFLRGQDQGFATQRRVEWQARHLFARKPHLIAVVINFDHRGV